MTSPLGRRASSPPMLADLRAISLRFVDPAFEAAYREREFSSNLLTTRFAYLLGIAIWIVWGLLVQGYLGPDAAFDTLMRYGVFIPLPGVGLVLSFTPAFRRIWRPVSALLILLTGSAWIVYTARIHAMPVDYGYVGLILIITFAYTLVRLPFLLFAVVSGALILEYLGIGLPAHSPTGPQNSLSWFYLLTFWTLGLVASYVLDRSGRLLFLRERQLERERSRSESLLRNVLPEPIADRLKQRQEEGEVARIADGIDEVTVLFADTVGFTLEAQTTEPQLLVGALDDLFSRFDSIGDRLGLEKIKTVGDAYMAASGAPTPRPDHAASAARMALEVQRSIRGTRWPSGRLIELRIGIASGPVVAGIIGRRKFSYDLWGDTVNLASRLESHGEPGRILVSEGTAERLGDGFQLSPVVTLDLKGKGPTRARFLLGSVTP
jgi:class 3 adenylate cyclase